MRKIKKMLVSILVVILISAISTGAFIGNLVYDLVLNPKISKNIIYADNKNTEPREDSKWLIEESNYIDEYVNSFDNLKLHAYIVKNKVKTDKWAIVVHGYAGNGKLMSDKAKYFYEMGYNVLIPDLRGHGESEGNYIGMGWDDRLDIISWINHIIEENPKSEIVLHGTSMGAATVLMTSGENLPSNVKAIISDSAYTSILDEFKYELKTFLNLSYFPLINITDLITMIRAGYSFREASAINQVKKAKVPILFIHGDSDKFVPYYMMNELYDATNVPKEKLTVEGAEHANSDLMSPYLYWLTIMDFLEKYV
ncbi:alpha/beta hydrolase [Terrisporobacter mayombei]|nr:alpha/beta hydrolase [Terrisporobacter mayombei]